MSSLQSTQTKVKIRLRASAIFLIWFFKTNKEYLCIDSHWLIHGLWPTSKKSMFTQDKFMIWWMIGLSTLLPKKTKAAATSSKCWNNQSNLNKSGSKTTNASSRFQASLIRFRQSNSAAAALPYICKISMCQLMITNQSDSKWRISNSSTVRWDSMSASKEASTPSINNLSSIRFSWLSDKEEFHWRGNIIVSNRSRSGPADSTSNHSRASLATTSQLNIKPSSTQAWPSSCLVASEHGSTGNICSRISVYLVRKFQRPQSSQNTELHWLKKENIRKYLVKSLWRYPHGSTNTKASQITPCWRSGERSIRNSWNNQIMRAMRMNKKLKTGSIRIDFAPSNKFYSTRTEPILAQTNYRSLPTLISWHRSAQIAKVKHLHKF